MQNRPIVIIGAGNAGFWLAEKLAQLNAGLSVILLGDEGVLPYDRPVVSKGLLMEAQSIDEAVLADMSFYAQNNIDLRSDEAASCIDTSNKTVFTTKGSALRYRKLVIATGARPRAIALFPDDLKNVFYLRNVFDAQRLQKKLISGKKVAVIGGGFVGLEVAAAAKQRGCHVAVFEAEHEILARVLPSSMGARIRELHQARGVDVNVGSGVEDVELEHDSVKSLTVNGEDIAVDVVVVGVGAVPNSEIALDSGIQLNDAGAILVDEFMRTNVEDIFAIGDVAAVRTNGGHIVRRESWDEARWQAVLCAKVIAGNPIDPSVKQRGVPWFWTDQFDISLQILGDTGRNDNVDFVMEKNRGEFIGLANRDGIISGAYLLNCGSRFRKYLEGAIAKGEALEGVVLELHSDMDRDIHGDHEIENTAGDENELGLFVCSIEDVPDGGLIHVSPTGIDFRLGVARIGTAIFVFDDKCNHGNAWLSEGELVGCEVECPFHGGRFDLETGAATYAPCTVPLKTLRTHIFEGRVFINREEFANLKSCLAAHPLL